MNEEYIDQEEAYKEDSGPDYSLYLKLSQEAHAESEAFMESGLYSGWLRNYALAQSEHPQGSKYGSEAYKHRSKTFRGKTEASLRKNEAAAAIAMFSSHDVVSIQAENSGDGTQGEIADFVHELVNSRLDKDIKWFMTAIGGYHEAMITGNVCSEQFWEYERNLDTGEVVVDRPNVTLYPLENVKISPNANWIDPVHSSPYVIIEAPMFLCDIKERMKDDWIEYDTATIQATSKKFKHDIVKASREGKKQSSAKKLSTVKEFDLVFVHLNFIKVDGEDTFFYTLGTDLLLSEPVPVIEAYPHLKRGKRPIVFGTATIEPHKVYSRSLVDRVTPTQIQSNEISNLRFDNVRLVLNKRKYVARGMGVDYNALRKSIPGQGILMDDINAVRQEDMGDVTASSYREQDMVNLDFDDLSGSFSGSSIASNRSLGETVGGMTMLNGSQNTLTEYQLRVFVETWVEPVVRQIKDMVLFYEDDAVIQKVLGREDITHDMLQIPLDARVSVGFGSTDPQQKVQKMAFGVDMVSKLPGMIESLDGKKLGDEVFSLLGFNDSSKFFKEDNGEDPKIQQLMQQIQQLSKVIETKQIEIQGNMQLEEARGNNRVKEAIIKATADSRLKLTELAMANGTQTAEIERKTGYDSSKLQIDLLNAMSKMKKIEADKRELSFKASTGRDGI